MMNFDLKNQIKTKKITNQTPTKPSPQAANTFYRA